MGRIILDLCGGTGAWSKPYVEAGYDVKLVTLPEDIRLYQPPNGVWGILAAPPCTEFSGSGARWWKDKDPALLLDALSIVGACFRIIMYCNPVWWVLENPVGRLRTWIGDPDYYFHPCDFGDPYTKKTCLWGKFNEPIKTPVEPTEGSKMHLIPPGPKQKELRSVTPPGFARAFFEANP